MKALKISKKMAVTFAVSMLAICCVFLFSFFGKTKQSYSGPEFDLRRLPPAELLALSREGLSGNCSAAYKVARHHMYYSLDDAQATIFFRLAAKCPNANALASLIAILASNPMFDTEVDQSLAELRRIDPRMAESASVEIALRRHERVLH